MRIGFLDIETTGLSPEKCKVILAGISIPDGNRLNTVQILADNPSEEPLLLRALLEELEKLDMVVTFNGASFDLPFIAKRCEKCKIHMNTPLPYDLDLYRAIRSHSPLKKMLPNLKQKTVENFLGLWESRLDEISGKDSIDLYYIYAGEKDEKLRDLILLHNHDDIVQLSKLIRILDRCDLHSFIFRNGFTDGLLTVDRIELRKKSLKLIGTQRKKTIDMKYFGIPDIDFRSRDRSFVISLPLVYSSGLVLCDAQELPFDLDSTVEGYSVLVQDQDIQYESINSLAMHLMQYIYEMEG